MRSLRRVRDQTELPPTERSTFSVSVSDDRDKNDVFRVKSFIPAPFARFCAMLFPKGDDPHDDDVNESDQYKDEKNAYN